MSFLPSGLYQAPSSTAALFNAATEQQQQQQSSLAALSSSVGGFKRSTMPVTAYAPVEKKKIELYSSDFYKACTIGGILACGITHTAVTPLDVVKCNMQIDPKAFPGIGAGFSKIAAQQGVAGLFKGWVPTLFGYSAQGAAKFGLYEYFKKQYSDMAGPENAARYQNIIYLAGSASAEFFADIALCPFEAVKVKVQTVPGFARGLTDGLPKFVATEGVVQALYKYVVPKPKSECNKTEQIGVSFAAGYIAGVFCAVVSHPADNLVSKLNATKGATAGQIIKDMGWVALMTRGLPLRIVMIGTLTGLQWSIYDAYKVYVGLPTTGSAEPAKK
ncbi:hypothetical protein KSW81_003718 [Nannochloris sp. 'desiccata']|nr:hypothetical protein KSW81_003718 [Chlorella desiccata (nom. nud.)]